MNLPRTGRAAALSWLALSLGLSLATCGSNDDDGHVSGSTGEASARTVSVALTDAGCEPAKLYTPARVPYERIEPVAESFGDLDPAIDARAGDVPAAQWSGFHKIEQALWIKNTTKGMAPVARKLLADVTDLQRPTGRSRRINRAPATSPTIG